TFRGAQGHNHGDAQARWGGLRIGRAAREPSSSVLPQPPGTEATRRAPCATPRSRWADRGFLRCFGGYGLMIVADLFDFTVHDLHYFCADGLDSSTLGSRPREERLRDSVAAV